MRIRRTLGAAGLGMAVLLTATACGDDDKRSPDPQFTETEDCDFEDFQNRETDCGFPPGAKKASPTPTKSKASTISKPKPRKTNRR